MLQVVIEKSSKTGIAANLRLDHKFKIIIERMQQKFKITKEREVVLKKFGIRSPNDPDICLRCNTFDYRGKSWRRLLSTAEHVESMF